MVAPPPRFGLGSIADLVAPLEGLFERVSLARCGTEVNGCWDRLRIDQVLNNLIGNAMKYGQGKTIEVDVRRENGDAIIRVVDHGIGIDQDHQQKIFQRFERAVASTEVRDVG